MTRSTFLLVGQPSRGSLLAGAEHTKDWIQLLHRNKVYFRRAKYLRVIPHIPRWNQSASAKWWREVISNTCWQQRTGKVRLWREVWYFKKGFSGPSITLFRFFCGLGRCIKGRGHFEERECVFSLTAKFGLCQASVFTLAFQIWHLWVENTYKIGPNFNFKSFQTLSI